MLGSSHSVSGPNTVLNTIVAEELSKFADILEHAENFESNVLELVSKTVTAHKRIIFNGNNYCNEWVDEAERRGLLNLKTTVDVLPSFIAEKNIRVFSKHKVFSEDEIYSRYEILLENYCKVLNIEALTMLDMVRKEILPAVISYIRRLSETALAKQQLIADVDCDVEKSLVSKLSSLSAILYKKIEFLSTALLDAKNFNELLECARFYKNTVLNSMQEARAVADEMELLTQESSWPFPSYSDLLFRI